MWHFTQRRLLNTFLDTNMKFTSFSKTLHIIGLTTIMTVLVGTHVQQTAQAQLASTQEAYMPCSEAYFSDPDFMPGSGDFLENLKQRGQLEQYEQALQQKWDEIDAINAAINVFAVDLNAPIGYVAKKVNGVAVEIPPEVEKSIQEDMAYPYSREKVKALNEKYSQYATLGQQISLVYSPAQTLRAQEIYREANAITASYQTPEEKQADRDLASSQEHCSVNYGFADMGLTTITIEVGKRPDLDARLREDTTGATFFR